MDKYIANVQYSVHPFVDVHSLTERSSKSGEEFMTFYIYNINYKSLSAVGVKAVKESELV